MRWGLFASILLCMAGGANAQSDTSSSAAHSPRRATILSACLPGAGQVYNHKYWKVPVIYASFGALAYAFDFNNTEYKFFRQNYIASVDNDTNTVPKIFGTAAYFQGRRNYYKKYRDLTVIGMVALYGLQILDANVDAHLMYFDVGEDLSLSWQPLFRPIGPGKEGMMWFEVKVRF